MTDQKTKTAETFVLPASVVSRLDVSKLVSEMEQVDSELTSAAVRSKAGASEQPKPVLSDKLSEFLQKNELNLDDSRDRSDLIKQIRKLKDTVPVIHMTFAVAADRDSLQKLTQWLRDSIHPQAVIAVGLQPALVGGVYLRTTNRIHDFSLRAKVEQGHDLLLKELEAARGTE